MKKKILIAVMMLMVGLLGGCKKDKISTLSFNNLYDYSAISGISLLSQESTKSLSPLAYTEEEKENIINNIKVVEDILKDEMIKSVESTSNRDGYEVMYSITVTGLDNKKDIYEFHYKETVVEIDEDETKTRLEGIVILNDVEYLMIGEKEVEDDEVEMLFKIVKDKDNYVIIEQEIESDEKEFKYVHYLNGKKVYETELEFENENGKIEVEFKEKTIDGKKTFKYEFVNKDNKQYVKVVSKNNGVKDVAFVEISEGINGEVVYSIIE